MSQLQKAPWYYLVLLILAGESVFIIPFVLPRVFRPTVLDVFALDNTQLGLCFSVYGLVALVSYLFGGPLADKFPPRKLIAIALWMTALGGQGLWFFRRRSWFGGGAIWNNGSAYFFAICYDGNC